MTGTPDEHDLRHALHHLVDDEPDSGLAVDEAVTEGRRLRRRHRARVLAPVAALGVVAVAGAAVIVVSDSGTESPSVTTAAAAQPFSAAARTVDVRSKDPSAYDERASALLEVLREHSPAGWTYSINGSDEGVPSIDGTADDGAGAASISVSSTNTPGMLTVHPCTDPDYRQGAPCHETTLADGTFLSVRGIADYKGIKTIVVGLTHADGTGSFAEAGNFTTPPPPPPGTKLTTRDEKLAISAPTITRDAPLYTTAQLAEIVKATEKATKGWKTEPLRTSGR